MNPESFIAPLVIAAVTIGAGLIAHAVHDAYKQGRVEQDLQNIKDQLGTHETGMRGHIHEQGKMLTWLGGCVWYIANKVGIELPKRDK